MRVATIICTTLILTAAIGEFDHRSADGVQLRDGTVYFVQPPDLVDAITTFKGVNTWGATYYFTINVPAKAGEPLQRVTITQREGVDNIRYDLEDSRAFVGTPNRKRERLTLGEVTRDRQTRTVTVNFNPPVAPGQTFTIGLRPLRNPRFSGVYLFGVTAFPVGEKSHGQFLGYGRFHFYGGGSRRFGLVSSD